MGWWPRRGPTYLRVKSRPSKRSELDMGHEQKEYNRDIFLEHPTSTSEIVQARMEFKGNDNYRGK